MEIQQDQEPSPYQHRIAQLRHELSQIQQLLREFEGEAVLRDRLLDRMRPLYDDLFALHSEIELERGRQH
ncbi:MAG: hypothetical protein R6W06_02890 [Prochlorococcaceae cyanobacterium]